MPLPAKETIEIPEITKNYLALWSHLKHNTSICVSLWQIYPYFR